MTEGSGAGGGAAGLGAAAGDGWAGAGAAGTLTARGGAPLRLFREVLRLGTTWFLLGFKYTLSQHRASRRVH